MSPTSRALIAAGTALSALSLIGGSARAQQEPASPGMEVQARGPVHEAFAKPFQKDAGPTPVVPKQPPRPVPEEPPDQKPAGNNVQWIPGYWAWDDDKKDYLWITGASREVPP